MNIWFLALQLWNAQDDGLVDPFPKKTAVEDVVVYAPAVQVTEPRPAYVPVEPPPAVFGKYKNVPHGPGVQSKTTIKINNPSRPGWSRERCFLGMCICRGKPGECSWGNYGRPNYYYYPVSQWNPTPYRYRYRIRW